MASLLPPRAVWLGRPPRSVHILSPPSPPSHHGHLGGLFSSMRVLCSPLVSLRAGPLHTGCWREGQRMNQAAQKKEKRATWNALSVSSRRLSGRDVTENRGKSRRSPTTTSIKKVCEDMVVKPSNCPLKHKQMSDNHTHFARRPFDHIRRKSSI